MSGARVKGGMILAAAIAACVMPSIRHDRAMHNAARCALNENRLGIALELYSVHHGGRYPTSLDAVVPDYLAALPTCPSAGYDTYSHNYRRSARGDAYTLICGGLHHADAELGRDEPTTSNTDATVLYTHP